MLSNAEVTKKVKMKFDLKNKFLQGISPLVVVNFLILLAAMVMYTDTSLVAPDIKLRILFFVLLILPLFKYPYLTPAVLAVFVTIRQFSVAPFGYIPSTSEYYFFIILLISISQLKEVKKLKKPNYIFYGLFLIPFFSNLLNLNYNYEFLMFVLILILLLDLIKNKEQLKLLEISFVLITFILAIYALIFAEKFIPEYVEYLDINRSYWTDPNYLGSILALGLIISFYYIITNRNKMQSIFYLLVIMVGFMALGIIASRGALISALIPMIYIVFKKTNSAKKVFVNFLIVIAIIFVGLKYVSMDALIARFNDDTLSTGSERSIIWKKSIEFFLNSDYLILLFGGGTNYALELCGKVMRTDIYSPHNNFLQILYDYGFVGLVFFLFFMGKIYLKIKKNILAVALLFSFVITAFTLVPLMYMPFWLLLAFIVGSTKIGMEDNSN